MKKKILLVLLSFFAISTGRLVSQNYELHVCCRGELCEWCKPMREINRNDTCNIPFNLGNDTTLCGATAFVINPGIVLSPFSDSLTIIYDASKGVSGLSGANKVYMHAGAELHHLGGWQHVTGNWGLDDGIGKMKSLGSNLWTITINPVNYFGYHPDSTLHGIFMVFRNEDGTLTGKNNTNEDIWVAMNPPSSPFDGVSLDFQPGDYTSILWSNGMTANTLTVTASGTYSATATTWNNCTLHDTIAVTLASLPIVNIGNDTLLCHGSTLELNAGAGFSQYFWNNQAETQTITVDTSGVYSVTVTNAHGCSAFDIIFVSMQQQPQANFSYIMNNLTINITDNSLYGQFYAWDFNSDGTPESTQAGNVSYTYPEAGQYMVTLNLSNACGADTHSELVLTGSIDEIIKPKAFNVFPIPAKDIINIQVNASNSSFHTAIIQTILGDVIESKALNTDNFTMNVSSLPVGTYIIRLLSHTEEINQVFIIN